MEFKLNICIENAAFDDVPEIEIARVLHAAGEKLKAGYMDGNVRDLNGNIVGRFELTL